MQIPNVIREGNQEYSHVSSEIAAEPIEIELNKTKSEKSSFSTVQSQLELEESNKNNNQSNLFEELINSKGMTKLQIEALLFSFLINTIEGLQSSLTGITFLPILLTFNVSGVVGCLIASSFILFMAAGNLLASRFTSKYGRKKVLIIGQFVIAGGSIIAFIKNLFILFISRSIIGFALGVIIPVSTNNLIEILPKKRRSFYLNGASAFFSAGAIISTQFLKFTYPNIGLLFLILTVPSIIIGLLFLTTYKDNPRYLLLNGEHELAFYLLEVYFNDSKKLEESERVKIAKDVDFGMNKEVKLSGKFEFIFRRYFKMTLILSILWVLFSIMMNGGVFSLFAGIKNSSLIVYVDDEEYMKKIVEIFMTSLRVFQFFYWFLAFSTLLGGLLTEIVFIGRKKVVYTGYIVAIFICILSLFVNDSFYILYIIGAFCINISYNAINTYAMEIYPTRVRDFSLGYLNFISKISGFFSNILALYLKEEKHNWVFFLNGIISIIGIFCTFSLPVDTIQRNLDTSMPIKSKTEDEVSVSKTVEEIII